MKRNVLMVSAALLAVAANADVSYIGANGGNWTDGANWSGGEAPIKTDTVQINSDKTVYLNLEWIPNPGMTINVDGTIDQQAAMRLWGNKVNVSSSGTLDGTGGGWLVLWGGGAEFNFDSGATITQDTGRIQFGNNADQTLGFNLASDGFETLSAYMLHFDGYAGQTTRADMADYTGGAGTIELMTLSGGNNGVTDALFQGLNLDVANAGAYAGSTLSFNETTSAIELNVVPEPATLGLLGIGAILGLIVRRFRM